MRTPSRQVRSAPQGRRRRCRQSPPTPGQGHRGHRTSRKCWEFLAPPCIGTWPTTLPSPRRGHQDSFAPSGGNGSSPPAGTADLGPRVIDCAASITGTTGEIGRNEDLAHTVAAVPPQYCQGNRRNTRADIARGRRGRHSSPTPSPLNRATRNRLGTSASPALCSTPIVSNNCRHRGRPGRYPSYSPLPLRRRRTPTQSLLTQRVVASRTWHCFPRERMTSPLLRRFDGDDQYSSPPTPPNEDWALQGEASWQVHKGRFATDPNIALSLRVWPLPTDFRGSPRRKDNPRGRSCRNSQHSRR